MQRKVPLTQFSSRTSFNLFFTVFHGKPQGKQINKQKPITNTTVYHQLVNMTSTNIGKNWPTNPQTGGTFGGLFNNEVTKTYMRISPYFSCLPSKKIFGLNAFFDNSVYFYLTVKHQIKLLTIFKAIFFVGLSERLEHHFFEHWTDSNMFIVW